VYRALAFIVSGAALFLGATWFVQDRYYQLMFTLVPIWATVGVAWNLFSGYSGLMSFGHAAFFGIGAYTVALLFVKLGLSPWFGIVIAGFAGALAGVVIGFPTFKLRGHYFALAMLAYPLALLYVFEWLGLQEVALPMNRETPAAFMQFSDQRIYVLLAVVLLVIALVVNVAVARSRFGLSLLAIKQNELAAMAVGINPRRWKLKAIALSGALTAVAGGLYAVVLLIVTPPAVFGMLASAQAMIVTLFGGIATVAGPVIGALILVPLGETLHAELGSRIPGIQGVVFGAAIMIVVLLAPEGILPWIQTRRARRRGAVTEEALALDAATFVRASGAAPASEASILLAVNDVSVRFGGLRALQKVSFEVREGEILGIIGPNAAAYTRAQEAIVRVGLAGLESRLASSLTTVELRLMEIARALAAGPRLLLLDETLAGLGASETEHVLKVVEAIRRGGVTVVIIEHTMHAMVRLADRLLVLDHGEVCAVGDPAAVTSNPAVIEAYLGKKWAARAAA